MKKDPSKLKLVLAKNMKKYRKEAKLTQEKAAEKADMTVKYWQRLEMVSQIDLPSLPMLEKIAKSLGIKSSKLLE